MAENLFCRGKLFFTMTSGQIQRVSEQEHTLIVGSWLRRLQALDILPSPVPGGTSDSILIMVKVASLNTLGLSSKIDLVARVMERRSIDVLFACETWWSKDQDFRLPVIATAAAEKQPGKRPQYGCALLVRQSWFSSWQNRIAVLHRDDSGLFMIWMIGRTQFIGIYIPPSFSPDESTELVGEAIRLANLLPSFERRVILGDLNLHLRSVNPTSRHSHADEALAATICQGAGVRFLPLSRGSRTYRGFNGEASTIIDHFAISTNFLAIPKVVALSRVEDRLFDSDHLMICAEFEEVIPDQSESEPVIYKMINLDKLQDPEVRERYCQGLHGLAASFKSSLTGTRKCADWP